MNEKVVLFGASNYGKEVFDEIVNTYDIVSFCDNDSRKIGTLFCDKPVISVLELNNMRLRENIKVIITSSYFIEISVQLSNLGFDFCVIAFLRYEHALKGGLKTIQIDFKDINLKELRDLEVEDNSIGLIVRNNSGSNTLAIWKLMLPEVKKKYKVKLIYESEDIIEYYKNVYTCKILVTTHSNNLNFLSNQGRRFIQLWHGFPMKGVGLMEKSIPLDEKRAPLDWPKRYNTIISYSLLYSTLLNACFGGNASAYKITGAPRNDFLFRSDGRGLLSKILGIGLENKKILFFVPTFRVSKQTKHINGNKNWHNFFGFEELDSDKFNNFLVENNIILILKLHPYEESYARRFINIENSSNIYFIQDHTLCKNKIDFYEVLNACDLLITDYSSIFFDYLLLDRPMIFTPIDYEDYIDNTGLLYGPYDFWTPGKKVNNQVDLQNEILKSLKDESYFLIEREKVRTIVHHYQDGESHLRTWNLIVESFESV